MDERPAWYWYLLLWAPARIERRLAALEAAGVVERAPNLWQVWMGVLYMWTRVVRRPETIGLSDGEPVRDTPGARRLRRRRHRARALFRARAVNPLDQVGLGSSAGHIRRHLLGAYHPGDNFLYDLQILDVEPGEVAALEAEVRAVVEGRHPDATFLRDLVVYEGYHERLLAGVEAWRARDARGEHLDHPDTTLPSFLGWCASMPPGPRETLGAATRGELSWMPP